MTASIPSTVSRYRPAILFITGISAAYAAYLLYDAIQASDPSNGLQRSNAVRRRRTRDSPSHHVLSLNDRERPIPPLGEYELRGQRIPLDPYNLVEAGELRGIILNAEPGANDEAVEEAIEHVYAEFLDRLFAALAPGRALSLPEIHAVHIFLSDRYPDNPAGSRTAVASAATRHAHIFPPSDGLTFDGAESVAHTEVTLSDDDADDAADPEGQTLQRTLYHIAEDRARLEGVIHRGITCNGCDEKPIRGTRWHCANCVDFDLCSNCEATNSHYKNHIFYKIRVPAPYLGLPKQEPLYPGKPHMMSPSIYSALKRRLVRETSMEGEEIEALWDQFTCLAGTEWTEDATGVGWAIDRREFNHAFIPRYNNFVAAPNLVYDRIFAYYDTDKNGLIGFDEWVKGLDGMHTSDVDVKARIVFNGYDIDGDGYISRKDILRIFRAYYAIEKEATRNHIEELSEEMNMRNALETIRSSQPLGSAFPPRNMATSRIDHARLQQKDENNGISALPVLSHDEDVAEREEILRATDIHHIAAVEPSDEHRSAAVTSRWARRQFYVDEEEGLTRPEGAETSNLDDEAAGASPTNEEPLRNRGSRSSSRVRFQDDVEIETRSNTSSSRPVGERWGGYEIPEPEQDLGKEVLYQITQQGFNELLNPLFLEKEDMAMDADETRSERRTLGADIEFVTMDTFMSGKPAVEAIVQVGVFRYSKCTVEKFCEALNSGTPPLRAYFERPSGGGRCNEQEARSALVKVYESVQNMVLGSIKLSRTTNVDNMTMWNTLMCKRQLQKEVIDAVIQCALFKGWLSFSAQDSIIPPAPQTSRDPTMPQFRPNSLADVDMKTSPAASHSSSGVDEVSDTDESSLSTDEDGYPERYFFVATGQLDADFHMARHELTASGGDATSPPVSSSPPLVDGLTERLSVTGSPLPRNSGDSPSDPAPVNWRSYTDNPDFHHLSISQENGMDMVQYSSNQIIHSNDPYHPEMNPLKPLQRQIRQMAMHPDSHLHLDMLASLETVEHEISERKGSGLISFEEFLEHVRAGRARFLDSWMEWVSM